MSTCTDCARLERVLMSLAIFRDQIDFLAREESNAAVAKIAQSDDEDRAERLSSIDDVGLTRLFRRESPQGLARLLRGVSDPRVLRAASSNGNYSEAMATLRLEKLSARELEPHRQLVLTSNSRHGVIERSGSVEITRADAEALVRENFPVENVSGGREIYRVRRITFAEQRAQTISCGALAILRRVDADLDAMLSNGEILALDAGDDAARAAFRRAEER